MLRRVFQAGEGWFTPAISGTGTSAMEAAIGSRRCSTASAPRCIGSTANGGALGPLAGRIWRLGLMGSGATLENAEVFLEAFREILGR